MNLHTRFAARIVSIADAQFSLVFASDKPCDSLSTYRSMEKNFETNFASRNFVNQEKDRKLKKKTDIKKYYASFRERYPRMPKDTIRHDTTKIYRVESKRASEVICTMAHECCMTVWITIPRIPIRPRDY